MNITAVAKKTIPIYHGLNCLQSLWWLFVRLWIARIFFKSGMTKIDNFDTTIMLFAEEYKVPVLSPTFAAYSATTFELVCPVLLVLGLATRIAVLPLLVMTAVIQFTYMDHIQHYYWTILLFGLLINGAGKISLDHAVYRRMQ